MEIGPSPHPLAPRHTFELPYQTCPSPTVKVLKVGAEVGLPKKRVFIKFLLEIMTFLVVGDDGIGQQCQHNVDGQIRVHFSQILSIHIEPLEKR